MLFRSEGLLLRHRPAPYPEIGPSGLKVHVGRLRVDHQMEVFQGLERLLCQQKFLRSVPAVPSAIFAPRIIVLPPARLYQPKNRAGQNLIFGEPFLLDFRIFQLQQPAGMDRKPPLPGV